MKFSLNTDAAEQITADCLIVGLLENEPLTATLKRLDEAGQGFISALVDSGDLPSGAHSALMLIQPAAVAAKRLMLVNFGKRSELTAAKYYAICLSAAAKLRASPAHSAISCLHEVPLADTDPRLQTELSLLALHHGNYHYTATKVATSQPPATEQLICCGTATSNTEMQRLQAIANGVEQTRILSDLPPNICTPAHLEAEALAMAGKLENVSVQILQEEELRELGLNALLAVGRGSAQDTRLIVLRYRGGGDSAPIALVGKGVTFDSGGLSLKTRDSMEQMKFDMGGAAAILGTLTACASMKLPINLDVVVAAVENMPDGLAYRPGDVLTTYEGLTVEVLNTDAEGRLALCDALSWTKRQLKPRAIVDVATLTGACIVALGLHASAVMSPDDELAEELLTAGERTGDRAWRLPLWPEYQEQLETPYADLKNVGGHAAGTITAGCFLQRFVKDQRWAHMDVAGSMWPRGVKKSATGRPVRLLCQWLQNQI